MQFAECSKTVNHMEHRKNSSVTSVSPCLRFGISPVRSVRPDITEWHVVLNSLSFDDRVDFVGNEVFQSLNLPCRPAHFDHIDLSSRSQTETKSQIVLRKIAAATANFVKLRHRSAVNRHARSDRRSIALRPNQTKQHAMIRA